MKNKKIGIFIFIFFLLTGISALIASESKLGSVAVRENNGLNRQLEYVEFSIRIPVTDNESSISLIAVDSKTGEIIPCQSISSKDLSEEKIRIVTVIFPVNITAHGIRQFILKLSNQGDIRKSDLKYDGEDLEIKVENKYYLADMTKSDQSEAKSHASGQIRELLIKMDYDINLLRTENRMHWAPNFQKTDQEYYTTIAAWENPKHFNLQTGPYLLRTVRQDLAPNHPEIRLTATYSFYSGLPYFRFYSSMRIVEDVMLKLLRNDEMTMDTLFTHVAFERPDGEIRDLAFSERYSLLEERPIENNALWLCFYNKEKGYAFGSIRLKYDNDDQWGNGSPLFHPHTKISDGAGGGKYWNRRLIDEKETYVPKGSQYTEENAYLVFSINDQDKFKEIKNWADRLKNPIQVDFYPAEGSDKSEK
jgi:hypothetical protein